MNTESNIESIELNDIDLIAYAKPPNIAFQLVKFTVNLLPKGKVTAAKILGRKIFHHPRGTTSTASGVQIAINRENIDFFAELAKRHGTWEDHVRIICKKLLAQNENKQVFYDIGANSGYVSLEIADKFGDNINVFAFEPQPNLAKNIAASAGLNKFSNVTVFQVMLGDQLGESELFLVDDSIHASGVARNSSARPITCVMTSLDLMIKNGLPAPDLIKIDVEGGELAVFRGATELIKNHQPTIVFEVDENTDRFGYSRDDLLGFLLSLTNYDLYFLDRKGNLIPADHLADNPNTNMVAIPRGTAPPLDT